ncbi:MAG: M3 family oligoendopeptidase [Clostridia bacterium]|nr:M3 family oligoendopeptidase [Clostridia bacterium]
MLVKDIPYKRYTLVEGQAEFAAFKEKFHAATCADDVMEAKKILDHLSIEYETAASLAFNSFSLNTASEFYQGEVNYYDEVGPLFSAIYAEVADMMLSCPFRAELETKMNPRIFRSFEVSKKAFDPIITEDMQKENAVVTEYSKFMSGLKVEIDGVSMPLSVARGRLEDTSPEVRKQAAIAIDKALSDNGEALDSYYDRLVAIRHEMAVKMGYKNYVELGYYRMGRLDYDADTVSVFRANVAKDLVPVVCQIKADVAKKLGVPTIAFHDNDVYSAGQAPTPQLDEAGMFRAAAEMYDDMHPEVGAFMHFMQDNQAFDVEAREGKWGGGYCTAFPKYKQPFILANFNGSSGDVDVLTHEFGHALADYFMFKEGDMDLGVGGMETAECHSMSMEFFSWKYMDKFFGEQTNTYLYKHLLSALCFIPYGVMVDEFQHVVYEHPEYTPAQRNDVWKELENKYRPYLDFTGLPYLGKGTRWQYQMHIYERPFYYIDYCLAQTVALSFLVKSQENYDEAFAAYLEFVRTGGRKSFPELIKTAGLPSPFDSGALAIVAARIGELAKTIEAKL